MSRLAQTGNMSQSQQVTWFTDWREMATQKKINYYPISQDKVVIKDIIQA